MKKKTLNNMHVYIYNSFLDSKKYSTILAKIETRITDLGLSGKIIRLSVMKNIEEAVKNELGRGAKTIVAVGDDKTVNQVANAILGNPAPMGIIPIKNKNNEIGESLGISCEETACDVLAARRIEQIDVGLANNFCFLSNASITSGGTIIEINKNYTIETQEKSSIKIINLPTKNITNPLPSDTVFNPKDGSLELCIFTDKKNFWGTKNFNKQSLIPVAILNIVNTKNTPLIIDGVLEISTPAFITVAQQKLNVIVGKNRVFN